MVPQLRFKEFRNVWVRNELSEICTIERGRFSPRPRNDPAFYGGEHPFVQTRDVVNASNVLTTFTQTLNDKGLKVSKLFPSGTILITIAANIGHTAILGTPMACPDSLVGLQCRNEVNNYFLNYVLNKHQEKMDYLAIEAAQKNINIAFLSPYVVTITPIVKEQQKIADFLTAVDLRLEQLRQKHALLLTWKKGVMQQLFSGAIRFKDDEGNDFPAWEDVTIGDICSGFSGGTPTSTNPSYYDGTIPFIRSAEISSGSTALFLSEEGMQSSSSKMVVEGDLLLALYGANSGEVGIAKIGGAINQAVLCLRSKESTRFLFYWFQFSKEQTVKKYLQGGQGNLSGKLVQNLTLDLPVLEEQKKISSYLSTIDIKLDNVHKQIELVENYKQGLLQQMFV